jgi:hypothetical protein
MGVLAQMPVAGESPRRAGVQRHQTMLVELGVAHHQHFTVEVKIGIIEGDRFSDPDAADRQQADQALVSGCPKPRSQRSRGLKQRADFRVGIQI